MADISQRATIKTSRRLQAETERIRLDFLRTELELSSTFLAIAKSDRKRGLHGNSLQMAEAGYSTVKRFLSDAKHTKHFTDQEWRELTASMNRLRRRIDRFAKAA